MILRDPFRLPEDQADHLRESWLQPKGDDQNIDISIENFCDLVCRMVRWLDLTKAFVSPPLGPTLCVILNASELIEASAYIKYGMG